MSKQIQTQTLPASVRKTFATINAEQFVQGLIPFADGEQVKPSAVKMNKASAAAAMGGKADPYAFITGLSFFVAAYAYGQGKLETLQQGLPASAQFALVAACQPIKFGAGITAGALRHAVLHGLSSMLALPLPEKKVPAIIKVPSGQLAGDTAEMPEAAGNESASEMANAAVIRTEAAHDAAWSAYGDGLALAMRQAVAVSQAPDFIELFGKLADSQPEQALETLQRMAAIMGMAVRKMPTKKAA